MEALVEKYPSLREMGNETFVESHDGREERLLEYILHHPDLSQMKGNPDKVLAAIEEYAYQKEFMINIGADKARILHNIILDEKPKTIIELGAYVGYSAVCLANAMKQASPNVQIQYWSLELEERFCKIAEQIVELAGLGQIVKFISGPAADGLRQMPSKIETVDFLFLDHVEDLYVADLQVCEGLGLLKPGSLIVADNVLRPGAPEYRKYVRSKTCYDSKAVAGLIMPGEFEDEFEVTRVISQPPKSSMKQ